MDRLKGKVAIITGGAAGIGAATARVFVQEGAQVFLVDRDENNLVKAADELGPYAGYSVADVSEEADNRRVVAEAVARFGGIDIALLNAGIEGDYGTIADLPVAVFDKVMAVNVRGVWLGLAAVMPEMRSRGGGSIVVTSSVGGLRGTAGWASYATSKHAVIGLAKSAALEGAKYGVRVNTVNPAPIHTQMIEAIDGKMAAAGISDATKIRTSRIPLGRYGEADEIAKMMLFLASDDSSYCTAGTYLVDGGIMTG